MGVTSEAVLIFGWSFYFGEFKQLILSMMEYEDTEDDWEFIEFIDQEVENYIETTYPGLKVGRASPWYDCYPEDMIFYITVADVSDIRQLFRSWDSDIPSGSTEMDNMTRLMIDLNLRDPPDVEALVNVY